MKNKLLLIILTILFSHQLTYGQKNELVEFNSDDLIGIWYPKYNRENTNLIFEKRITTKHQYGSKVEILKNGEFHNRYSAPCGNDTMLRTHNYNGKWNLNKNEWIITTTEPINRKGTVYKIVELKSDRLILTEIKTEKPTVKSYENQQSDNTPVSLKADENWLITTIENFFLQDFPKMADITTKEYAEYKQDAIGIEYDGLTQEEFELKWKDKYDIELVGYGSFVLGQQDWGKIKVTKCKLIESKDGGPFVFDVIVSDTMFKLDHKREITVIIEGDKLLINDVKHLE